MNRRDTNAFITVSSRFTDIDTDFLDWVQTLVVYGLVTVDKGKQLRWKLTNFIGDKSARFIAVLGAISGQVSFDDFINVMYKQGLSDFAHELRQERYGDTLARLGQADVPHARFIQKYYSKMKQNLDNGVFGNSRQYLRELTVTLKVKINQSNDADTRQFNAEKLVAVYVLFLPQYSGYNRRKAILDDMKTFFHETNSFASEEEEVERHKVDSSSADIIYSSKMGITSAIAGDFDAARRFALEAECLGSLYRSSLARTVSYHDHQYVSLLEFKNAGDEKTLGQVLSIGDRGLRAMVDEHDDIRYQWNRLFMQYKVLTLLGISSDFKMSNDYPTTTKLDQAKVVLKEMRGNFKNIEQRREMIYNLCMARVHERSDTELAIDYVNDAIRLSQEYSAFIPGEKQNIHVYLRALKRLSLIVILNDLLTNVPISVYALVVLALAVLFVMIVHG